MTEEMDLWQSCVGVALVGTNRQSLELPQDENALTEVIRQMNWAEPEGALLGAVGAIALHQKVGWRPEKKEFSLVAPFDESDLLCCSPRVMKCFEAAARSHTEILIELLQLIAAAGQRVPATWLPRALLLGKRNKELRQYLIPVLGKRGWWLAAQNSEWAYVEEGLSGAQSSLLDNLLAKKESVAIEISMAQLPKQKNGQTALQWLNEILTVPGRWNMSFSRAVLTRFFELAEESDHHIKLSSLCGRLAISVHPGLGEEIVRQTSSIRTGAHHTLEKFLDELCQTVKLRQEIYLSFVESG